MAAHLREIIRERCAICGGPATKTLHNTWNAPVANYCARHARRALVEFLERYPDQVGGDS